MRKPLTAVLIAGAVSLSGSAAALAAPSPNGPGQPGAPGTTCGSPDATNTPGHSALAPGSPFNANGNAGMHYAGNPGTASAAHSNSSHAVSQYDIACFQQTSNPGHS